MLKKDEKISILYVDDEDVNVFLFTSLFDQRFEVHTALSGLEALEELDKLGGRIDAVVSDMNMPEMNGIEFVYRAHEKYQGVSYFILTGYDYNDEIDEAIEKNVVKKYFSKPFEFNVLSKEIEEQIQR